MPNEIATATDFLDLLNRVRLFAGGYPTIDSNIPDPGNTGDGTITLVEGANGPSPREAWTITAVSATSFTVVGSVSGAQATNATVGLRYTSDDGNISFLINAGGTPFVATDFFTITVTAGRVAQGRMNKNDPLADPGNTGDGTVEDHGGGGKPLFQPFAISELWTVTLTSATTFDVSGSTSGAQGSGTVGVDFTSTNGMVELRVVAGGTPFVATDFFTMTVTAGTPWEVLRGGTFLNEDNWFIPAGAYPPADVVAFGFGFTLPPPIYTDPLGSLQWKVKGQLTITNGGLIQTGTGNGTLALTTVASQAAANTWFIEFTSATAFRVSVVGFAFSDEGTGTTGVAFTSNNGEVTFTITVGGIAFVAGDRFTFGIHNIAASIEDSINIEIRNVPNGTLLRVGDDFGGSSGDKIVQVYGEENANAGDGTLDYPNNFGAAFLEPGQWEIDVKATFFSTGGPVPTDDFQLGLGWAEPAVGFVTIPNTEFTNLQASWRGNIGLAGLIAPGDEGEFDKYMTQKDLMLKGIGSAGQDEIFVGIRTHGNSVLDVFQWSVEGFTGDPTTDPSIHWRNGPGHVFLQLGLDPPRVPLDDDPMDYWLDVNGRRILISMKVTTVFESAYLGFLEQTTFPSEYPYPLAIGGTIDPDLGFINFSSTTGAHRAFMDPATSDFTLSPLEPSSLMIQRPDTLTWGFSQNRFTNPPARTVTPDIAVWPWIDGDIDDQIDSQGGEYLILPAVVYADSRGLPAAHGIYGTLDGIFHVSGFNNAAENTFVVDGDDYVVFQNTYRTDIEDFWAMRLDTI